MTWQVTILWLDEFSKLNITWKKEFIIFVHSYCFEGKKWPFVKANSWGVIPTAVPFSFVFISTQITFLKNWHIIPSNNPSKNFNKSNKFARKPKWTTFLSLSPKLYFPYSYKERPPNVWTINFQGYCASKRFNIDFSFFSQKWRFKK